MNELRLINECNSIIYSIDDIADSYDSFLIDNYILKTAYWQFVKETFSTDYCELHKNIL